MNCMTLYLFKDDPFFNCRHHFNPTPSTQQSQNAFAPFMTDEEQLSIVSIGEPRVLLNQ